MLRRAWLRNLCDKMSRCFYGRRPASSLRRPIRRRCSNGALWPQTLTLEARQLLSGANEAPTAVVLSTSTVSLQENTSTSSAIELATIGITDDGLGTNVLSLSGPDAASFEIVGSTLRLKPGVALNYEVKQSYSVTVNVDDASVGSTPDASSVFTLSVLNINEAPTLLTFSGNTSVAENLPAGTLLGTLSTIDPDAGNTFTYSLPFDAGDPGASESFQIVGNEIRTTVSFDFETRRSYLMWIRSTDQDGLFREQGLFISVTNVNEPPTAVVITPRETSLPENTSTTLAEIVATFKVTDDSLGSETLTLSGPQADFFFISGFNLLRKAGITLDFETTPTLSVTINADDPTVGASPDASATYTLNLTNLNEAPTAISLSDDAVDEDLPAGAVVGSLVTTDQDAGSTFTYALVPGLGDSGNAKFKIVGNQLLTTQTFNFETQAGYSIRLRTTDQGGLSFENFLTVMVTNINEAPTAVVLDKLAPEGAEFRVNTTTANAQAAPSVAMTPDGGFVVVWQSQQDGSGSGVYAQRYGANGVPVGTEFQVNVTTLSTQDMAKVAMGVDGSFIVTWRSLNQDGSGAGVYGRRYSAAGIPLSGEFLINTTTAGSQEFHSLAARPDGSFVVTWQTPNQDGSGLAVYARRYSAAGVPIGGEFLVNTTTNSNQSQPSISTDLAGNFVIVWSSLFQEGAADTGIYGQRYNASGVRVGGEFHINTTTEHSQSNPSIAHAADGSFVVTWMSIHQDGSSNGIYARRYNAAGVALGGEFRVNTTTVNSQQFPVVEIAADGSFLVSWTSLEQDGSGPGVYAQRFNAAGDRVGEEFRVNTETFNSQINPAVASDAQGNLVIAWSSLEQDGSQLGVYAQRYKTLRPVVSLAENTGAATPLDVAPITVTDEGLGANILSLSGPHASFFEIVGTTLRLKAGAVLDFEATPTLSVTVNVDDPSVGGAVDASAVYTLTLTNVNEAPTAIALDNAAISENQPAGTVVGRFSTSDQDVGNTFTYTLVSGTGDSDNGSFAIVGNQLQTTETFDRESRASYSIRVRTTDQNGLFTEQEFLIAVLNVNEAPTGLSLDSSAVAENQPIGSMVGRFSTSDPDVGNTFTYTLVSGAGDSGNGSFAIVGNQLQTTETFDHETRGTYSIRVRTTDQDGLFTEQDFLITVLDVNESPSAVSENVTVTEDGSVQISLHGSDPESAESDLIFTITSLPSNGTLRDASGNVVVVGGTFTGSPTLTYSPGAEATSGLATGFTFIVQDPLRLTSPEASVEITVTPAVAPGTVTIDSDGVVRIGGTSGDDVLILSSNSGFLNVSLNGVVISHSISMASVSEVRAWVYDGNDVIDAQGLDVDTVLFGGVGHDSLAGGSATDIIFGGDGNDTITGAAGNDLLAGGAGMDRIVGSAGNDVLIAGTIGGVSSLEDIKSVLGDWVEGVIQTPDDSDMDDSVLVESDYDKLTGASGADWFIIGQSDVITDFKPGKNTGDLVTSVR